MGLVHVPVPAGAVLGALLWTASHGHQWVRKAGSDAATEGLLPLSPAGNLCL